MNKEFIEDFLIFCGHDLKNLQNIDTSVNYHEAKDFVASMKLKA